MHRRHLIQGSAFFAASLGPARPLVTALARQGPEASPYAPHEDVDQPVDPQARELVARLAGLSPLEVLEALETGEITEPVLTDTGGAPATARPWNDPLDTDLEHALGGVLIVTSDDPLNSPELATIGAYIVFESPEIAFTILSRQLAEKEDAGSTSVAGTKAWLATSDGTQLAIMRLGYVLVIATTEPGVAEGLVEHLAALMASIA